jgi:hypothetical protein
VKTVPITSRVTLRCDDAITALVALKASISRMKETMHDESPAHLAEYLAEKQEAYHRIAKSLGVSGIV